MFALGVGENFAEGLCWNAVVFLMELRGRVIYVRVAKKPLRNWAGRMSTDSETFVNVRLRLRGPRWTEVLTMTLTEMFTICDSCAYAPCLCGNDPENCVAYVMRTSNNG